MESITWMAPILPGKLDAWHAFHNEMSGPRRHEHDASRRRMGATREVASLMRTPQGDFVCLYNEGEDLAQAFRVLAESTDPYDVWFRERAAEIHGMTAEMWSGPPPVKKVFDWPFA
jgi:hypothetical protein